MNEKTLTSEGVKVADNGEHSGSMVNEGQEVEEEAKEAPCDSPLSSSQVTCRAFH